MRINELKLKGMSSDEAFYESIPSFTEFRGIIDPKHYRPLPGGWQIFVTDVRGSTKAIESGRYKDVNTVGAASITAVHNVFKNEFPFVFGGDGASIAVPAAVAESVREALTKVAALTRVNFDLELRVGMIGIDEIRAAGYDVRVARNELVAGRCVAAFCGGGLTFAEKKIKGDPDRYCCPPSENTGVDLTGLSCRWNPLPSRRGSILSVLLQACDGRNDSVYREFLDFLRGLYDGDMDSANPVNTDLGTYKTVGQCWREERRYVRPLWSLTFAKRVFEICAAVLIFRHGVPAPPGFNAPHYRRAMRLHSDYRKYDDMLRMVLDASPEETRRIREFLEQRRAAGEIYYGLHESQAALMTCFFEDSSDGRHIHFIDGGDGGYAMASRELKQQMIRPSAQ